MSESLRDLPIMSKKENPQTTAVLDRFFPEEQVDTSKYKKVLILTALFYILANSFTAAGFCNMPGSSMFNALYRAIVFAVIVMGLVYFNVI